MRRDLTDNERAELVAKLRLPQWKAEAKERVKAHQFGTKPTAVSKRPPPQRTWIKVAKEAGVSRYKARKAVEQVERESREPKRPRTPKPPVNKLAPEHITKRFGMFLKYWPSHTDQRKVREYLRDWLK